MPRPPQAALAPWPERGRGRAGIEPDSEAGAGEGGAGRRHVAALGAGPGGAGWTAERRHGGPVRRGEGQRERREEEEGPGAGGGGPRHPALPPPRRAPGERSASQGPGYAATGITGQG